MSRRRIVIAAVAGLAVAAGAGGAIAASGKSDEQAVIDSAAKHLDVSPEQLREALGKALDERLDAAVKDGRITQAQADEMKQRRAESGRVLGGPAHRGGPGHQGSKFGKRGGPRAFLPDAARALGITQAQLRERLHDGETLAEIAKAEKKDLADVKSAVRKALVTKLDAAVKAEEITAEQRKRRLDRFDEFFDRFATSQRR